MIKKLIKLILIGLSLIFILGITWISIHNQSRYWSGPCSGTYEVGQYEENIESETQAKQMALEYYNNIGFNLSIKDLTAHHYDKKWRVRTLLREMEYQIFIGNYSDEEIDQKLEDFYKNYGILEDCSSGHEGPCYSPLTFENKLFGKNKILGSYIIPC